MSKTQTNPIHPDVWEFARATDAVSVKSMGPDGAGRVRYDEDRSDIVHVGCNSELPEGLQANLTLTPTPTIDLFPPR